MRLGAAGLLERELQLAKERLGILAQISPAHAAEAIPVRRLVDHGLWVPRSRPVYELVTPFGESSPISSARYDMRRSANSMLTIPLSYHRSCARRRRAQRPRAAATAVAKAARPDAMAK